MKIISLKEVEVDDAEFKISINLVKEDVEMKIQYRCFNCSGYGCHGRTTDCNGGTVSLKIDPSQINKHLDADSATKLKDIIYYLNKTLQNGSC